MSGPEGYLCIARVMALGTFVEGITDTHIAVVVISTFRTTCPCTIRALLPEF